VLHPTPAGPTHKRFLKVDEIIKFLYITLIHYSSHVRTGLPGDYSFFAEGRGVQAQPVSRAALSPCSWHKPC
jgi:hypothetical protein